MAVEIASRGDSDLEAVRRVSRCGEALRLAPEARLRMDAARTAFLCLIDRPEIVVYGVTSYYGDREREARRLRASGDGLAQAVRSRSASASRFSLAEAVLALTGRSRSSWRSL